MRAQTTISETIQRAAMQLDGIGLEPALLDEATAELEADLEKFAATALRRVLTKHIAQLAPQKKPRKSARSGVPHPPEARASARAQEAAPQ